MNKVLNNYRLVLKKMEATQKKFSPAPPHTKLIVVTKTFKDDQIIPILKAGHTIYGENKVQEAQTKWQSLKAKYKVELHLIGPLQSNKVRLALETFDAIQTIDREKVAKKIIFHLNNDESLSNKSFKFFIQVNTGNEPQKSGCDMKNAMEFILWCKNDLKLQIHGLMCIPPVDENPEKHFDILNNLANQTSIQFTSMGMTSDYLLAIKNKASYVRVGSAIFGKRSIGNNNL